MIALLFLIRHCFFFGFGLGLLDGYQVIYTLHTFYIVSEFGGQVQLNLLHPRRVESGVEHHFIR